MPPASIPPSRWRTGCRRSPAGVPPPREMPFWVYLLVSVAMFAALTRLGLLVRPGAEKLTMDVDLDFIAGIENEPPPLGDPEAASPATDAAPEPVAPSPPTEPDPKPPAEPVSEPEIAPEPPPPPPPEPEPTPAFEPPPPLPPAATPPPRIAAQKPKTAAAMARSTFQSGAASNPGTRGVATGVAGGRGGQRGGFSARPNPPYDSVMLARRYQGSGKARITVANGKILSVSIVQSSGISYLDSKAAAWIRSRWKPAPGTEGTFTVPFIFRLAR